MFHRHQPPSHQAGRLVIAVTEIRPDDPRRDEKTRPETVVHYMPLSINASRENAFSRAAKLGAAISPAAHDRFRVKVVTQ